MDTDPALEGLMSQLGGFGKYQLIQHLLHVLSALLAGIHMLSLTTVAPTPNHRCFISEIDGVDSPNRFTFNESILSKYIPMKPGRENELDYCSRFDGDTINSIHCEDYVYDLSYHKTSRVINWGLICDKRWERALIQSIYMFGVLMGAIILGGMADKYGRKTIFYFSAVFQLIAGLASAFIPNFVAYCIVLFFYGMFGSGGAYVTGFVLTMELVGPKRRTLCGTAFSMAFGVGVMIVAAWGFFITDCTILQVVYALHSLLLIGHWWLVDESIRWLWGQGRTKEALKIIEKGVRINGGVFDPTKSMEHVQLQNEPEEEETSKGIADLFKTPVIRKRALTVAYLWFANSLVYYGLSLNTGRLSGNPFLMLFLIGLAEVPGYFTVIAFVDRTGRRCMCSSMLLVGGIACLVVSFLQPGIPTTALVMIGKMAIAGSFAITYNYTAELFPTVVRNSAVGLGASSARFSGMLTPMVTLLDTVGNQIPTLIFGGVSIVAALLTLILPETVNKEMPQTIEDGERFGRGDTGYRTCLNSMRKKPKRDLNLEVTERLNGFSHNSTV